MERKHGHDWLSRGTGRGVDAALEPQPMSATVVLRSPDAAGYGRHAAPASAYGPSDVHRLLPVPPVATERRQPGTAPVEAVDLPGADAVVAVDELAAARSLREVSAKATGFLARLRLLPKAA